jgi:hypothetical protein
MVSEIAKGFVLIRAEPVFIKRRSPWRRYKKPQQRRQIATGTVPGVPERTARLPEASLLHGA